MKISIESAVIPGLIEFAKMTAKTLFPSLICESENGVTIDFGHGMFANSLEREKVIFVLANVHGAADLLAARMAEERLSGRDLEELEVRLVVEEGVVMPAPDPHGNAAKLADLLAR
ncbi:hypothetical protein DWF04_015305 [Cereibacter sphaeroides f. sp. denitrificans]|nr:hypothetical protein DWF04_16610 [Cereibacter sphaeroides f. sp. denitrificans]